MHASKYSMWREILKNLAFWEGTKQGLGLQVWIFFWSWKIDLIYVYKICSNGSSRIWSSLVEPMCFDVDVLATHLAFRKFFFVLCSLQEPGLCSERDHQICGWDRKITKKCTLWLVPCTEEDIFVQSCTCHWGSTVPNGHRDTVACDCCDVDYWSNMVG